MRSPICSNRLADEHRVTLTLDLASARCQADSNRVAQVLLNLLTNAPDHTPADGCVTIRTLSENSRAVVTVSDTGPWHLRRALAAHLRSLLSHGRVTQSTHGRCRPRSGDLQSHRRSPRSNDRSNERTRKRRDLHGSTFGKKLIMHSSGEVVSAAAGDRRRPVASGWHGCRPASAHRGVAKMPGFLPTDDAEAREPSGRTHMRTPSTGFCGQEQ